MPANLTYHSPINSILSVAGQVPLTVAVPEKAGQTFKYGVPVQLSAGFLQQWDGATIANAIAGFSMTTGLNLATSGKGAPGAFGQVGPPGATQTYGSVPNTPGGVNIAVGSPMSDGRTLFESATELTIFEGIFDNSAGAVAADYTPTQAMVGTQFGLTIDANGQFYVDAAKVTAGTNTVVQLVGVNPIDGFIVNARVRFQVLSSAQQLIVG